MKILYIASKYDYGKPERGYGFEHYNFYDSLVKMDNKKHEIFYFPFDEIMINHGKKEMNRLLIETALKEKPDFCFFFLFTDEIKKETIKEITEKGGAITFNWFADDHWRFDGFSRHYAPYFNFVSTTDSEAVEKYYKIGYKNVIKTQWACNHFLYKPAPDFDFERPEYKHDVTFVGQPHGNRKAIVEKMIKNNMKVECWGYGWRNGKIDQEKMIRFFSESKINLNLTKSMNSWTVRGMAHLFFKRSNGFILPQSLKDIISNIKVS